MFHYVLVIVLMFGILIVVQEISRAMYPLKYKDQVYKYSNEYQLDPYLVFAVIKAESSFDARALSRKNAKGLMQITDETGMWIAEKLALADFTVDRLYDPDTNIRIGCWYLNWLTELFAETDLVIAAYNGGNGNVREWLSDKKYSSSGKTLDKIPFRETEQFLKRVKKYYAAYKRLYGKSK